jgi:hypothetical protein
MPWTLDKSRARFVSDLNRTEQGLFDRFQNAIANEGLHPKTAADQAGDTDYKNLQGDQFQIRLSGDKRATFTVDKNAEVCTILEVGGHT